MAVLIGKTARMRAVEEQHGEDLEQLIPRLYDEADGKLTKVAERLGVNYVTLWAWMGRLGIQVSRGVVRLA